MDTLREWARDKSLLLTIFSADTASSIDDIFDYLLMLGEPDELEIKLPKPPSDQWLALYNNEYSLQKKVLEQFKTFGETGKFLAEAYERAVTLVREPQLIQEYKKLIQDLSEEEKTQLGRDSRNIREFLELSLEDVESFLDAKDITSKEKTRYNAALLKPEFTFFMRVAIPCFLLYQESPCSLFRKAQEGRIEEITRLLKIDTSVLQDDVIFKHYTKIARKEKVIDFNLFNRAIRQKPVDNLTIKTLKIAAAKFIWQLAEHLGYRMTSSDLRSLFDIIRRGRIKEGRPIDEVLQNTPDSFYMAVKRYPAFNTIFPSRSLKV